MDTLSSHASPVGGMSARRFGEASGSSMTALLSSPDVCCSM
ncbi:hypothetical protein [Streptomyces sp. NPDC051572]